MCFCLCGEVWWSSYCIIQRSTRVNPNSDSYGRRGVCYLFCSLVCVTCLRGVSAGSCREAPAPLRLRNMRRDFCCCGRCHMFRLLAMVWNESEQLRPLEVSYLVFFWAPHTPLGTTCSFHVVLSPEYPSMMVVVAPPSFALLSTQYWKHTTTKTVTTNVFWTVR